MDRPQTAFETSRLSGRQSGGFRLPLQDSDAMPQQTSMTTSEASRLSGGAGLGGCDGWRARPSFGIVDFSLTVQDGLTYHEFCKTGP